MKNLINSSQEPLSIYPTTFQILKKSGNYQQLISLYMFYYFTAKVQGNNQIWANIAFTAEGVDWSVSSVRKYRKKLLELGLIELIPRKTGRSKQYIKINFLLKQEEGSKIYHPTDDSRVVKNAPLNTLKKLDNFNNLSIKLPFTIGGITRNPPINGYSKIHHLHPNNIHYLKLSKEFYRILKNNKKLNNKTKLEDICKEIRLLVEVDLKKDYTKKEAIQAIKDILKCMKDNIKDKYWPQAFSGSKLREKFQQLDNAVGRYNNSYESKTDKPDGWTPMAVDGDW